MEYDVNVVSSGGYRATAVSAVASYKGNPRMIKWYRSHYIVRVQANHRASSLEQLYWSPHALC